MINDETCLLLSALRHEEGHIRRTQHILKVYSLARLLGEQEQLSEEDRQILQAGAILHDIAIKYCKEHYNGDACLNNQKKEAPHLVEDFLKKANYLPSYVPKILDLVVKHHDYDDPKSTLLQLLMEADLIINCYETYPDADKMEYIKNIFHTSTGTELLNLCLNRNIQTP